MKQIFGLLSVTILIIACTKEVQPIVEAHQHLPNLETDTSLAITMQRCPSSSLTCFDISYPNYKDTLRIPISWIALNQWYFKDTLVITSKKQLIWTNNLFYNVVPIKF